MTVTVKLEDANLTEKNAERVGTRPQVPTAFLVRLLLEHSGEIAKPAQAQSVFSNLAK